MLSTKFRRVVAVIVLTLIVGFTVSFALDDCWGQCARGSKHCQKKCLDNEYCPKASK